LDPTGYVARITAAMRNIDRGRRAYAIEGKERAGRIAYEDGIAEALSVFKEACAIGDPFLLLTVEYTLLILEKQLCDKSDKDTINSLTKAIANFDDAFLAFKAVEDKIVYRGTELTFPHDKKFRFKGYARDAFHLAFTAHKTRLKNNLRTSGLDPIEKALLKQRIDNIPAAQDGYLEKQKKAFAN